MLVRPRKGSQKRFTLKIGPIDFSQHPYFPEKLHMKFGEHPYLMLCLNHWSLVENTHGRVFAPGFQDKTSNREIHTVRNMDEKRKEFLWGNFSLGFTKYIGMEPLAISDGKFESRMVITENHRQQDGFVHAGAVSTLADHTAGYAAFTLAGDSNQILTVEFKINFLAPAAGNCLICRSQVIRSGKRIMVTESRVFDVRENTQKMVALALFTMAVVPQNDLKGPKEPVSLPGVS